jgi:hypothetical protein
MQLKILTWGRFSSAKRSSCAAKRECYKTQQRQDDCRYDKAGFGNGNDGLETLSKLPGVQLDKDDNVVLEA